jgi:O-antigen ligase
VSALQRRGLPPNALGAVGLLGLCAVFGLLAGVNPKLAVYGVFGLGFVIVVFNDLVIGLAIYATMSFLEVLSSGGAGTSFDKVAGLLLFASWVANRATARRESTRDLVSRHPAMIASMVAFVGWSAISMLWASDPGVTLTTAYRDALQMLVVPIVYSAVRSRQDIVKLVVGYLIGATVSVIYGFVFSAPQTTISKQDVGRLVGSLGEANQAATVLVAAMALAVGLAIISRRSTRLRTLALLGGILAPIGLIQTLSRGGLIAAGVVLLVSTVVGGRWRGRAARVALVAVVGITAYFLFLAPAASVKRVTMSTTNGRNDVWIVGWRMFTARPAIGVGAGNFPLVSSRYLQRPGLITSASDFLVAPKIAHNTYLEQLSELGVLGLLTLLGVFAGGLAAGLKAAHICERLGDDEMELMARCAVLALVAFYTADFFLSGLLYKQLWLVFALGPALLKVADIERRRALA